MMKEHIKDYKERLEKGICEYMQNPVSERSADAVEKMIKCWQKVGELEKCSEYNLSHEDAKKWVSGMQNADGTTGEHWTIEQTTSVAESVGVMFDHISDWCWWVTMNMMYSDYCKVAEKFGVGTPEFYADMSKAFLFDKDAESPKAKLSAYYHNIAERK